MKKQIIDYGIGTIDLMQEGNCYQFHLLRADLHIDNLQQLEVLSQPDALFLPLAVAPSADAEEFILSCELPTEVLPWSHAQQETPLDRLRLCLQLAQYYQRQDIRQTIVFAPENMFYDASFHPVMLYRGVCDVLEPVACTDEQLLLMYQALIITTLAPRHTFASLMRGGLNRAKDTRLVRDIAVATTVAEVMACVDRKSVV